MKKKIVFIQLIQIICAWGVMNGHFMMHSCNDICDYLRNSNLKYSVLAFFFLGDLNVEVFFVLGGFLIRYADVNDVLHTILKKYVSVLMPGVCLTLAIAIVALINGDFVNSINDISILLTGNSYLDADQYIPHYLYQLWFCFPFIRAWTVAYLVSIICKDRNALFNVICIFILGSIDDSMTSVLLGMFFGRFTNILEKNKISSLGALIIGGLSIMLVPVLYAQKSILTNIVMYGLLGIAFQGMTLGNKYLRESKLINLINKYSVGVYYVHVIIVKYISTILVDVGVPIIANYFMSCVMIIILAVIFKKYVIENIVKCFEKAFDILERV